MDVLPMHAQVALEVTARRHDRRGRHRCRDELLEHFQQITAAHGDEADPDLGQIRELARRLHAEQIWNCPTMIINESCYRPPPAGRR
jgi:hypothetical protein